MKGKPCCAYTRAHMIMRMVDFDDGQSRDAAIADKMVRQLMVIAPRGAGS